MGVTRWPFAHRALGMVVVGLMLVGLLIVVASCGGEARSELPAEPWMAEPVSEWPDFALTNDIRFTDTTFTGVANAFLVDTGRDTVGATVKHMFMALRSWRDDIRAIDLGDDFVSWHFRSSRDPSRTVRGRLLNEDPDEPIGDFAGMKDRDWLVFELDTVPAGAHPLKPRYHPLDPGEDPGRTSGSAVIDGGGHLVGIVSGAVGELVVVAGVAYLRGLFEEYGIPFRTPGEAG